MVVAVNSPTWRRVVLVLVAAHVVWGLVRLPRMVTDRRAEIRRYRELGPGLHQIASAKLAGGEVLAWLRDHCGPGDVVLCDGSRRGPVEFAAAALAPRLLVAASACGSTAATYAGRPLARGTHGGRTGTFVLVALADDLRIEVR